MSAPAIIIESGLAGYNVAREFRKLDTQTPLLVISRDHAGFYSKPMLSNALAGKKTAETLVMKTVDKMATELNAQVLAHTEVTGVDTIAQTVSLSYCKTQKRRRLQTWCCRPLGKKHAPVWLQQPAWP